MTTHTVDIDVDEMLLMAVLLGQFIEQQTRRLRKSSLESGNATAQLTTRIAIASRLRGKLPLNIAHGDPDQ